MDGDGWMGGRGGAGQSEQAGGEGREHGPQAWLLETENWKRRGVRGRLCEFSSAKVRYPGLLGGDWNRSGWARCFFLWRKKLGGEYRTSLPEGFARIQDARQDTACWRQPATKRKTGKGW